MFSNEIETSGGHISGTTARWEVPLGFFRYLWVPPSEIHQNRKSAKHRGKSRFLVGPPIYFPMKNETSSGHISSTTAIWEVPLGFLDAPGFPLQKYIKIGKVPKNRGKSHFLVGPPMYFPLKTETCRGHNSSTP